MTKRWWVGGVAAAAAAALVIWSWQNMQEQQRLSRELSSAHTALLRVKAENATLQEQMAHARTELEHARAQRDALSAQMQSAADRIAAAEEAQRQADTALQALKLQQQSLQTDKTLLEGRLAVLQHDKDARTIPPTAGPSPSGSDAGNKGYMTRSGSSEQGSSAPRVNVLPDPNAGDAPAASFDSAR